MKWIGAWLLMCVIEVFWVGFHAIEANWDNETLMGALCGVWLITGMTILGIWCIVAA